MTTKSETISTLQDALNIPVTSELDPFGNEFSATPQGQSVPQPTQQPSTEIDADGLRNEDISALRDLLHDYRATQSAAEFVAKHGPQGDMSYTPCPENTELMYSYMTKYNLDPASLDNLETAFKALAEASQTGQEPNPPAHILRVPPQLTPVRPVSTGLSDSGGTPEPQQPNDEDFGQCCSQVAQPSDGKGSPGNAQADESAAPAGSLSFQRYELGTFSHHEWSRTFQVTVIHIGTKSPQIRRS